MTFAFYSIAHNAKDEAGHPFHYQKCVEQAVSEMGGTFSAWLPKNSSLPWEKVFDPRKKLFWPLLKQFCQKPARKSFFFIETFGRREFRSFALAAFLTLKKNDTVIVLYRDDLLYRYPKDKFALFFFTHLLKKRFKKRFIAVSDSASIADFYSAIFKMHISLLPIPHTHVFSPSVRKEKIICITPGEPRREKGMAILQKLQLLSDPAKERFSLPTFQNKPLTEDEYRILLSKADLVFLPYEAARYKRRTSGIFVEAISAGKMPLVTKDTWMAEELEKHHLSELILDWENPQFFTDLLKLIQNKQTQEKLLKMQKSYQNFHTLKNFTNHFKKVIL